MRYSPDGRLLACAACQRVSLWDAATDKFIAELTGHEKPIRAVAFSPDGPFVASGSEDGAIKLWDVIGVVPGLPPTTPPATQSSKQDNSR